MRRLGKWLGRIILTLGIVVAGLWAFGLREPVQAIDFDSSLIGSDVDAYLAEVESDVANLKPGLQKQVIWAGAVGERTELSVVYVHGYSASLQEIRPVPDLVAADLGANLVFTRLKGHGRDSDAMAEPSAGDWLNDTAEAIAIAKMIGNRVLILSTSTGGTLVATALADAEIAQNVVGSVFVSPNFKVANSAAFLLTWPFARYWVPLIAGEFREWQPHNAEQAENWTTRTPTIATLPMAALVKYAENLDFSSISTPALFIFSDADTVVRHDATRDVANSWGGPARIEVVELPAGSDPSHHVIAGDILSPQMNQPVRALIAAWFSSL